MALISWKILFLYLSHLIQLTNSQTTTLEPFSVTETFSATISLYTAAGTTVTTTTCTPTYSSVVAGHTLIAGCGPTTTVTSVEANAGLTTDSVGYSLAYVIDFVTSETPPICSFPTSGTWSLLPRIVFYMTLVFALTARTHEWLIGGALAAAMTYSSLAALQVISQTWTRRAIGELDIVAITGILSCSCLMVVPLLNWSSTIRNLGVKKEEKNKREEETSERGEDTSDREEEKSVKEGSSHTVLVIWGLLVAIGCFSAFVGILAYANGADWIGPGLILNGTDGPRNITCNPDGGSLNTSAGQQIGWHSFWMTREFVEENNCHDPCQEVENINTLFRTVDELNLVRASTIDDWYEKVGTAEVRHIKDFRFLLKYLPFLIFVISVIILQGIMHVALFWQSSPQKARWTIYNKIAPRGNGLTGATDGKNRHLLALFLALTFYFFALLIFIIAPLALVVTVIATEFASRFIEESETRNHVDQWGVFAVLLMVIIAALICHFEPGIRQLYRERKQKKINHGHKHGWQSNDIENNSAQPSERGIVTRDTGALHVLKFDRTLDILKYHLEIMYCTVAFEWYQLKEFLYFPRIEPQSRHHTSNKSIWVPVEPKPKKEKSHQGSQQGWKRDRERWDTLDKIGEAFEILRKKSRVPPNQSHTPAMQYTNIPNPPAQF